MKKELSPNHAQLALLCLLAEKPMHAYEIAQLIDERGMREWTTIGFSSVYYALNKMHQTGWLKLKQVDSDIGGPQRNIFKLTPSGRKVWKASVMWAITHPHPGDNSFLLGISAIPLLENDEIAKALQKHLVLLQETAQHLTKKISSYGPNAPCHVHAMFDYSLKQINASITWLEQWLPIFCAE